MFLLFLALVRSETKFAYCKYNGGEAVTLQHEKIEDWDAYAKYDPMDKDSETESWGKIHIYTNEKSSDEAQAFCAGAVDTYSSQDQVIESFKLFCEIQGAESTAPPAGQERWPDVWTDWMRKNIDYTYKQVADHPDDHYWKGIGLVLKQFDGMLLGATKGTPEVVISKLDFWMLQSAGDIDDLAEVWGPQWHRDPEVTLKCTGLIKFAPNYADLYFSQDTWSDMRELHAYLKEYNFNIKHYKAHKVSVSTRTAHISSVDDFWVTDAGLWVQETTMHNFNHTLYDLYVKPESVLTWIRVYHATWVTDSGKEWTDTFIKENSGTYNNEYLVVDTKKFVQYEEPTTDLLWIIEQYPGKYKQADITDVLVKQTYFPSINTPWFEELFIYADYPGQQQREPQKKTFWSYYEQPRYLVIKRDAPKIENYDQFKTFMRYNDWQHDELIKGEPGMGILSRYDLRPENGTAFGARRMFGGLDSKCIRYSVFSNIFEYDAINSPQHETNTPFNFDDWPIDTTTNKTIHHYGLPSQWKYNWTSFTAAGGNKCHPEGVNMTEPECFKRPNCGWCGETQQCIPTTIEEGKPTARSLQCPSNFTSNKCIQATDKTSCNDLNKQGFECGWCICQHKCYQGAKNGPKKPFTCENDCWQFYQEQPSYAIPLIASVTVIIVVFVLVVYGLAFMRYRKEKQPGPAYESL